LVGLIVNMEYSYILTMEQTKLTCYLQFFLQNMVFNEILILNIKKKKKKLKIFKLFKIFNYIFSSLL